jgi:hypothetical protein
MHCSPKLSSISVAKMTTNGITLQVTKTPGIVVADFRNDMAESSNE